jgi:hypothetical protein
MSKRSRLAKKQFEFKKCGDFSETEAVNEYRRQLHERERIANLRSKGLSGGKLPSDETNSTSASSQMLTQKPSESGWNKADYSIQINPGQEGTAVEDDPWTPRIQLNQFERAVRCGDRHSVEEGLAIYKNGLKTSRENKSKLSGSAAREMITSEGRGAAATPEPLSPKPTETNQWNIDNYRINHVQNTDNKEAPFKHKIKGEATATFQRNQRCGDGFDLSDLQQSFRQSKLDAAKIRKKTNGGSEARDALTQRGRID